MKRFRTQILPAIGFMALMTTLGLWSAPKLMAAIKAALVQNVDEPGRNPYAEFVIANCTATPYCNAVFSNVPDGKRLVITNVSGNFTSTIAASGSQVFLQSSASGVARVCYLTAISQGAGFFGGDNRVVSQTVMAFVEPGQQPRVSVALPSGGNIPVNSMSFSISGYLVNLP